MILNCLCMPLSSSLARIPSAGLQPAMPASAHGRRLKRFANPKPLDDTLPLDFWLLGIDRKTDGPAGDSLVVETLRSVLAGEPIYTFQLDDQHVFDEEICKVLSGRVAFVDDCE